MDDAAFEGFGSKALPFLKALGFHQSRDWFGENRKLYESDLREPLKRLVATVSERFEREDLPLRGDPKASTFRINRDVRFAKEKHPYNTHVSAVLTRTGTKKDIGGVYMHFQPSDLETNFSEQDGSFLAAGAWFPDPDILRAWREDMVERPERIFAIEEELEAKGYAFGTDGTKGRLTRLPRGFTQVENERLGRLLRLKGFVINRTVPDEALGSADLVDTIVAFTRDAMPLLRHYWRIGDPVRAARDDT